MRLRALTLGLSLSLALGLGLALGPARAGAEHGLVLGRYAPARILISAGAFSMGLDEAGFAAALGVCALGLPSNASCDAALFADERPAHQVQVRAYLIDRTEVSQRAYLRCVVAGACVPNAVSDRDVRIGGPEQPAVQVTWQEAQSYCHFVGGSLPTEAQWERAARGGSARTFPWGEIWNARLANFGTSGDDDVVDNALDGYRYAAPVDAFPDGRSFYGALNMAGNVWELVLDRYAGPYDTGATRVDPSAPNVSGATNPTSAVEHVMRGGSWRSPPLTLRSTFRAHLAEDERRPDVGFRCAYPGPTPTPVVSPATSAKPEPDAGL